MYLNLLIISLFSIEAGEALVPGRELTITIG